MVRFVKLLDRFSRKKQQKLDSNFKMYECYVLLCHLQTERLNSIYRSFTNRICRFFLYFVGQTNIATPSDQPPSQALQTQRGSKQNISNNLHNMSALEPTGQHHNRKGTGNCH